MLKQDEKVGETVMKRAITIIATFGLAIAGFIYTPSVSYAATASKALPSVDCGVGSPVPLYAFRNNTTVGIPKPNFFTAGEAEKTTVSGWAPQYTYRGDMGKVYAASSGTCTVLAPVYRFVNQNTGSHFYTASTAERNNLIANHSSWMSYDGPAFVAWTSAASGLVPVYRYYNSTTGIHLFASDVTTAPAGFSKEGGAAFYVQGPTHLSGLTLTWPVSGGVITSEQGWRLHPIYGDWRLHNGTDIGLSCGSPVRASEAGTVSFAAWNGGLGNYVRINHGTIAGQSVSTGYGHLSGFASGIAAGVSVTRGQVIGYVGTTGESTGCHLHWELILNGNYANPVSYVNTVA